jgi:hypothetical protein
MEGASVTVNESKGLKKGAHVRLIHSDELIAAFSEQTRRMRNSLALWVNVMHNGNAHDISLIPDLVLGLKFPDGSRRCFMVEIDRGTMPVSRSDFRQTSVERKDDAYFAAYASGQHEQQFGWKNFRVLTVTTDEQRIRSMQRGLRKLHIQNSPGTSPFFFASRSALNMSDPLAHTWHDGNGRDARLA